MRERVLAVLGAVALVAVAVLVRSALSGDDDGGGGGGGSSADRPVAACTAELADVCEALADAGAIAADPPTLELADAAQPPEGVDAWITWSPAPALAGFDADPQDPSAVWPEVAALASEPLAVALVPGPASEACGADPTWACLAEAAAGSSGLRIGVGRPSTAEGIARLSPLARALAEDDDASTLDVGALDALLEGPVNGQEAVAAGIRTLITTRGELDAVVGLERALADAAATPQGAQRGIVVATPSPEAAIAVVVAGRSEAAVERILDRCDDATDALAALGLTQACDDASEPDDALAGFLWQVRREVG